MSEAVRELKEKAQALLAKRQHRKALAVLERVEELAPDDVFAAKKVAEILDALGEKNEAATRYVHLSAVLDKQGRRLQAIACCKLALASAPNHAGAGSLLESLYQQSEPAYPAFTLDQRTIARAPVTPPHPGPDASAGPPTSAPLAPAEPPADPLSPGEPANGGEISTAVASHLEAFVNVLSELCATFSGIALSAQRPSLTDAIAGHTDFLWLIQFAGAVEHTVVVSAQRRFILGLTRKVLDVDADRVTDGMAAKVSNKLIAMYTDDVKRAFATQSHVVHSAPPLPIAGASATYQLRGMRALHVPLSSDMGWIQVTIAGGL